MPERVLTIGSSALGNERPVWLRFPSQTDSPLRTFIVFLDAEMYRDKVGADAVVDLVEDPLRQQAAFAFVSAHSTDARWRECPCHPPFAAFVADELMSWLAREDPRIAGARMRVLVGLSYTGLAAAYVAKARPGVFQRVICQSGSFWWNDGAVIAAYGAMTTPLPTEFYLEVGLRETQTGLQHRPDVRQEVSQLEAVRAFRDALQARGHSVTHVETDGAHDTAAWALGLPAALRWALRSPSVAN